LGPGPLLTARNPSPEGSSPFHYTVSAARISIGIGFDHNGNVGPSAGFLAAELIEINGGEVRRNLKIKTNVK